MDMNKVIIDLLREGATPKQIMECAQAESAKLQSSEKLDKARLNLLDAIADYLYAFDPDLAEDFDDAAMQELDKVLRATEQDLKRIKSDSIFKAKPKNKRLDPADDDKIKDFLKAIGAL